MRNLILVHLESISATTLWQYRSQMETVWRLMPHSLSFTRFQSTATSTAMVMDSVLRGDSSRYDFAVEYGKRRQVPEPWRKTWSFGNLLLKAGYHVFYMLSNPLNPISEKYLDTFLSVNNPDVSFLLNKTKENLARCAADKRPFFLYFWDVRSHAAFSNAGKSNAIGFEQRFATGYKQVDNSLHDLLVMVENIGLLNNTTIVVFGDHGDELWTHGFNAGYCHATAPYASLCHTPLLIYSPDITPGQTDMLACTDDILHTLYPMVVSKPDPSIRLKVSPFAGFNLFSETRKYVFSNNLLPLQHEYSDLERGLTKSYSVTDGIYRLVVSAGGGELNKAGLEFFCDPLDPSNNCNLLHFYELNADGELASFHIPSDAKAKHLAAAFANETEHEIRTAFKDLKQILHIHIRRREKIALEHFITQGYEPHLFPEEALRKIRPRRTGVFD